MNKKIRNRTLLVLLLLVILAGGYYFITLFGLTNWKEHYLPESKDPYGTYVIREVLSDYFPHSPFEKLDDKLSKSLPPHPEGGANYVFIGPAIGLDKADVSALLSFAANGNTVFISSKTILFSLLQHLYHSTCQSEPWREYEYYYRESVYTNLLLPAFQDSTECFLNYVVWDSEKYYQWHYIDSVFFCQTSTYNPLIGVGTLDGNGTNFAYIKHGNGTLYLHTNPITFTNYHLIDPDNLKYAEMVFSSLSNGPVYWDNHSHISEFEGRKRNRKETEKGKFSEEINKNILEHTPQSTFDLPPEPVEEENLSEEEVLNEEEDMSMENWGSWWGGAERKKGRLIQKNRKGILETDTTLTEEWTGEEWNETEEAPDWTIPKDTLKQAESRKSNETLDRRKESIQKKFPTDNRKKVEEEERKPAESVHEKLVEAARKKQPRQNRRNLAEESPLKEVLAQPALAWAWYLALATLLLYLFFQTKRKQRIIPIKHLNRNASLEFTAVIGSLYYQQKNHKKLAQQMMQLFLAFVREKYHISAQKQDIAFAERLSAISEVDKETISEIFRLFKNISLASHTSEKGLTRFHNALESFYKKCK